MKIKSAFQRQKEIYISGISGKRPKTPIDSEGLRAAAQKKLSGEAWAYIEGGAADENTIAHNRESFLKIKIVPRYMRDNGAADFSSILFDTLLNFPFLLAPVGALNMVTKDADLKIAEACNRTDTPMIFSNQAGNSMEECSAVMGNTPRWFQLYWSKSDDLVLSFVRRAEKTGCKAIVLTVDTTMLGWRPRDLSLGYLPFLKGYGIAQYTSDPVFKKYVKNGWSGAVAPGIKPKITYQTLRHIWKLKRNYKGTLKDAMKAVQLFTQIYTNPSLTWEQVKWLKTKTELPIVIKGILHPKDAVLAREAGADGVIVSNHGGRQIDGAVSSIEMLSEIRKVLPKPFKILLDSGIRTGSDAFKAIALGADAVLLGRPFIYGLGANGSKGVEAVVRNFQNDFELTARLSGCRNLEEIDMSFIKR